MYGRHGRCTCSGPSQCYHCIYGDEEGEYPSRQPSCTREHVDERFNEDRQESIYDNYHYGSSYKNYSYRRFDKFPIDGCCPECNSDVVNRRNHTTGNEFTGCSSFPECRWTCNGHTKIDAKKKAAKNAKQKKLAKPKRVHLIVRSRNDCPFRSYGDQEAIGPPGPVNWCMHPKRDERGGDPWCPDKKNQRTDDPTPEKTPFPPKCPLQNDDEK